MSKNGNIQKLDTCRDSEWAYFVTVGEFTFEFSSIDPLPETIAIIKTRFIPLPGFQI